MAKTKYDVQSPFLHQLLKLVKDIDKNYYCFQSMEEERQRLSAVKEEITANKWGAGTSLSTQNSIRISQIARHGISCPSKCRLLFQLILHFKPGKILELGTSLGISSAYMASAYQKSNVITIEGNPVLIKYAEEVHKRCGLDNVLCVEGLFEKQLPILAEKYGPWDMVYLDGHHEEQATLALFEMISQASHNDTFVIIDDIYWSEGMANAWQQIIDHPKTTLCVDIYHVGIVFFNTNLSKEYFPIAPYAIKPWRIGLFV